MMIFVAPNVTLSVAILALSDHFTGAHSRAPGIPEHRTSSDRTTTLMFALGLMPSFKDFGILMLAVGLVLI